MHVFKTESGTPVELEITIGVARKIKAHVGIDMLADEPVEFLTKFVVSPVTRLDMLWVIATESSKAAFDNDQSKFEDDLNAESLIEAQKALQDEIIFFTQSLDSSRAEAVAKMLAGLRESVATQMEAAADFAIQYTTDPKVMKELKESMTKSANSHLKQLQNTFTESQAQSE